MLSSNSPSDQAARTRRVRSWAVGLPLLVILAVLIGLGIASGWLPSLAVPRKIIVRGNAIIPAQELIAATAQDRDANYLQWWNALEGLSFEQVRWLESARPSLNWERSLAIDVSEERPLLHATTPDGEYWLCEDYRLVPVSVDADTHPAFEQIRKLPAVEFTVPKVEYTTSQGEGVVVAAACLRQVIPGVVTRIKLDNQGKIWCYTTEGFAIKLGEPTQLEEKVGALPKALRLGSSQRSKLEYLDASDPRIFYQRWLELPEA